MQKAVGVRFRTVGRISYYRPGFAQVERGDWVIVETIRGLECGQIVVGPGEIVADSIQLRPIRRRATPNDLIKLADNRKREKEAFELCQQKIDERGLPMKLIRVEYTFDVNKIIFSFTSESRVDFRELVRDLAYIFRTRIELRQVGIRDETKVMGGIGACGRPLCCASFLEDFIPVSIRMAKEQNLSLNPSKISGACGRLMCCLQYEEQNYCGECPVFGQNARKEQPINNIDAENDVAALEKLEQLEKVEEELDAPEEGESINPPKVSSRPARQTSSQRQGDRAAMSNRSNERSAASTNPNRQYDRSTALRSNRSPDRSRQSSGGRPVSNRPIDQSTSSVASRVSELSRGRPADVAAAEETQDERRRIGGKKPLNKGGKPRNKRGGAYQRDKSFNARRPNLNDE